MTDLFTSNIGIIEARWPMVATAIKAAAVITALLKYSSTAVY